MEKLWQNLSALSQLLLILQTTVLTISVNTYNVWRENEEVQHYRLQYTPEKLCLLKYPYGTVSDKTFVCCVIKLKCKNSLK